MIIFSRFFLIFLVWDLLQCHRFLVVLAVLQSSAVVQSQSPTPTPSTTVRPNVSFYEFPNCRQSCRSCFQSFAIPCIQKLPSDSIWLDFRILQCLVSIDLRCTNRRWESAVLFCRLRWHLQTVRSSQHYLSKLSIDACKFGRTTTFSMRLYCFCQSLGWSVRNSMYTETPFRFDLIRFSNSSMFGVYWFTLHKS